MRPWDASTTPINEKTGAISRANEFISGTRPKAAKFGVYNLTDSEPEETVNSKGYVNRGTRDTHLPSTHHRAVTIFLQAVLSLLIPVLGSKI